MPGEYAISRNFPVSGESSKADIPSRLKSPGIARKALDRIQKAVSAAKSEEKAGDKMKAFLGAFKDSESDQQAGSVQTELAKAAYALENFPLTDSTGKFLKRMYRPSLLMRATFGRTKEQLADLNLGVKEQSDALLSKLVGKDIMQQVENGKMDLGEVIAAKVKELSDSGQDLRGLFGEPTDETIFPLKRMERALWKDGKTREAAKMLRHMRKDSGYTLPQYVWKHKDVLGEEIVMRGAQGLRKLGEVARNVVAKR